MGLDRTLRGGNIRLRLSSLTIYPVETGCCKFSAPEGAGAGDDEPILFIAHQGHAARVNEYIVVNDACSESLWVSRLEV